MTRQLQLGLRDELIVDNFAGGAWGRWAITYRPHQDPRWRNWFWVAARAEETGAGLS